MILIHKFNKKHFNIDALFRFMANIIATDMANIIITEILSSNQELEPIWQLNIINI